MRLLHAPLCVASLLLFIPAQELTSQGQQPPSSVPTLRVTSSLVFLDVTVLDKSGRPVVSGLTKDDFTITRTRKRSASFHLKRPRRTSWMRLPERITVEERHRSRSWCSTS
jgi:hypothetical protein